jgi:hypothetical protein
MRSPWLTASMLALALSACGDLCSQQSPCANDTKLTEAQIQECRDLTKDGAKCAKEQKDLVQCRNDKTTCDASGKTDGAKLLVDCQAQFDALNGCLTATP